MGVPFLLIAAAAAGQAAPDAAAPATGAGWRAAPVIDGYYRSCLVTSPSIRHAGAQYRILLSFGDRNAVGLRSSAPIPEGRGRVQTADGGTHYLPDLERHRDGADYVAMNLVSQSFFRQMLADLRANPSASLTIGKADYPLPMAGFEQAMNLMVSCSRGLAIRG